MILPIAAITIAIACNPDPNGTPTPTIQGDHDRVDVKLFRVYAQLEGDVIWPWHFDIPYVAPDPTLDIVEAAPGVLQSWPIQRVVPTSVQNQSVRVMMKAVDADGNESGPSNILTICMPPVKEFTP